jgi:hypothetical protein
MHAENSEENLWKTARSPAGKAAERLAFHVEKAADFLRVSSGESVENLSGNAGKAVDGKWRVFNGYTSYCAILGADH